MQKYCSNCGNTIEDGDYFCSACGTPVMCDSPVGVKGKKPPVRKKKGVIIGAVAVAAIACIVIGVVSLMSRSNVDTDILSWKKATTYDEDGEIIATKTAEIKGDSAFVKSYDSEGEEDSKIEYRFDGSRNLTEQINYSWEDSDYVEGSSIERTYNNNGDVLTCLWYSEGELTERDMYKYDDYGRLIELVCYDGDEELLLTFECSDDGENIEMIETDGGTFYMKKDRKRHFLERRYVDKDDKEIVAQEWKFNEEGKLVKETNNPDGEYYDYTVFEY